MKQVSITKGSYKKFIPILIIPALIWMYISYSRNVEHNLLPSNYKPYPFNRGIIHHIIYLDSPILEKPLNLNNYWIWGIIIIILIVIITLMNILVNIVSLSNEEK